MGYSVNKVTILGNVGKDPEVTYLTNGTPVAKFSVATTEKWKDQEGNQQEKTEWHNVVAWKKLAEIVGQYVAKGAKIYVEGKLQTRSWDDKNTGQKRYSTEIVAHDVVLLSFKQGEGQGAGDQHVAGGGPASADDGLPF